MLRRSTKESGSSWAKACDYVQTTTINTWDSCPPLQYPVYWIKEKEEFCSFSPILRLYIQIFTCAGHNTGIQNKECGECSWGGKETFGDPAGQWELELTDHWIPVGEVVLCRDRFLPLVQKEGRRCQGFLPSWRTTYKISGKNVWKGKDFTCLQHLDSF